MISLTEGNGTSPLSLHTLAKARSFYELENPKHRLDYQQKITPQSLLQARDCERVTGVRGVLASGRATGPTGITGIGGIGARNSKRSCEEQDIDV